MLGSATLDLAVGMMFVFLMLSLVVSAVREAIEARLKARAKHLAHGLLELLGDKQLVEALYTHPLIAGLYDGNYDGSIINYRGHRLFSWLPAIVGSYFRRPTSMPSYIPARTFALALVDLARNGKLTGGTVSLPERGSAAQISIDNLRVALTSSRSKVASSLLAALAPVGDDVEKALDAIQKWYDGGMDRVSGWFKRDTQHILFWLGLIVAVSLHVDSIYLAKFLAANEDARLRLAEAALSSPGAQDMSDAIDKLRSQQTAPAAATEPSAASSMPKPADEEARLREADVKVSNAIHAVTDLNLPLGWTHTRWNDFRVWDMRSLLTVFGWLLTAFGVSFGAPFWFDLLNKLMVIRSTVKPHEKSPEEASEDKQKKSP